MMRMGWTRNETIGFACVCGALALAALAAEALRPHPSMTVTASSFKSERDLPKMLIDGRIESAWMPEDHTAAWIDVHMPKPRTLHAVNVVNNRDDPYLYNATRTLRVTAYQGEEEVAQAEVTLPPLPQPQPTHVPLAATAVTRVRFEPLTHYGERGGIAEVTFE